MKCHVGTLSWAINSEQPQSDYVQTALFRIDGTQLLGSQFRDTVGRHRILRMILADVFDQGFPVHRGRRSEDQALGGFRKRGPFQQPLRTEDVVAKISLELASPAGSHTGPGCKMIDQLGILHQRVAHVEHIFMDKAESFEIASARQVRKFPFWLIGIGQGVDARNLMPIAKKTLAKMRSYEARAAGYEDFHSPELST